MASSGDTKHQANHDHEVDADDVPILTDDVVIDPHTDAAQQPDAHTAAEDPSQASLNAAIRQLESMELPSTKPARKTSASVEEKIRHTATAQNPVVKPTSRTTASHPAISKPAVFESRQPTSMRTAIIQDNPLNTPVEFTENQFLKSSTAKVNPNLMDPKKPQTHRSPAIEEDGAEAILKLLGETKPDIRSANHYLENESSPRRPSSPPPPQHVRDPFYDMDRPEPPRRSPSNAGGLDMDTLVEEIIDEYKPILEAALRKKLKEKMLDMIKK